MAKLPPWPQEWNDQSADTPREKLRPGPDINTGPERILDGWQQPGWSLENSGLSVLLHPQHIAQIDLGGDQGAHSAQAMADQTTGNMAAGTAMGDGESVIAEGLRAPSDGAQWEAKAYFINPVIRGGNTAWPKTAVHGGIKIYRNGKFAYSIDAGPQTDYVLKDGTLGNLVFQRSPDSISVDKRSYLADNGGNGEVTLAAPPGVNPENFAQALMMAARSYDDSLPYSLPPSATFDAPDPSFPLALAGGATGKLPYAFQDSLAPNTYNSNSFLSGLLANVGAGSNIDTIKQYVQRKGYAAPGIENLVPRDRFRNW